MQRRIKGFGLTSRRLFGLVSSAILFNSAFAMAEPMENYPFYIPNFAYPVLSLSGGVTFSTDVGKTQTIIDPVTLTTVLYKANHRGQTKAIYGGFAGSELYLWPAWHMQLGVGYHQPIAYKARGIVIPGGVIIPGDDSYIYTIRSHQLLMEGKFLYNCMGRFHPYIAAGIGIAFNDAVNYRINTFDNQFDDHSNTSFSYIVGAGLDFDLAPHWRIGAGYRYSDFGRTDLGDGTFSSVDTSTKLSQTHLYANEAIAELSYIFN